MGIGQAGVLFFRPCAGIARHMMQLAQASTCAGGKAQSSAGLSRAIIHHMWLTPLFLRSEGCTFAGAGRLLLAVSLP